MRTPGPRWCDVPGAGRPATELWARTYQSPLSVPVGGPVANTWSPARSYVMTARNAAEGRRSGPHAHGRCAVTVPHHALARRAAGTGLDIRNSVTGQTARARRGAPAVWIVGEPGELLLYLFGRQNVAEVDFDGPVDAIEAVTRAKFGL